MTENPPPDSPLLIKRLLESRPASPSVKSFAEAESTSDEDAAALRETRHDLNSLLLQYIRLIPFFPPSHPIRKRFKQIFGPPFDIFVRLSAKILHSRSLLASSLAYDCAVLFWTWVINLFFREIRPRGAWRIPKDGAVIFVAAPHHNQFVDPLLLMSSARLQGTRRISFLTAEASMKRAFVGAAARTMQSISVTRAADNAKKGIGGVYMKPGDALTVFGFGTRFTSSFKAKYQIQFPKHLNYLAVEVVPATEDDKVTLKKEIKDEKVLAALIEAGNAADRKGVDYKILPHVDQTKMYSAVYKKLRDGGCLGIFPEGGSHDRTDLLPLKAGVAIMALGALSATPGLKISIVPTGLSYFHPNKFRSRAVIEFGTPLTIPPELVQDFEKGGDKKREAIGKVLELIHAGLKSVTVRAPDFETLMLIQATRRLYRPPGQQLTLGQVVELNKRFIIGYESYKDEPRVVALKHKVAEYNVLLHQLGLKDHQVERANRPKWRSLVLLIYRSFLVTGWGLVALPGVVLNAPMFVACMIISRKKQREALAASTVKVAARDVVATWKILVSLGMSPIVYTIYGIFAMYLAFKYSLPLKYKISLPLFMAVALPSIGYSALKFGEVGMDIYKSLRPLFVTLMPGNQVYLDKLRAMRAQLSEELSDLIEEFGPKLFADFEANRVVPAANPNARQQKLSYGRQNGMLNHPFEWLDNQIWSTESSTMGSNEDYDAVISTGARSPVRRKSSGNLKQSKSGLQLSEAISSALSNPSEATLQHREGRKEDGV